MNENDLKYQEGRRWHRFDDAAKTLEEALRSGQLKLNQNDYSGKFLNQVLGLNNADLQLFLEYKLPRDIKCSKTERGYAFHKAVPREVKYGERAISEVTSFLNDLAVKPDGTFSAHFKSSLLPPFKPGAENKWRDLSAENFQTLYRRAIALKFMEWNPKQPHKFKLIPGKIKSK